MLHPSQFEVNETWVAFRLNGEPIRTEQDGDFNCIAMMDAASCFILGMELYPASAADLSSTEARRLLDSSRRHRQQCPQTLVIPQEDAGDSLIREAAMLEIAVVRVPGSELEILVGEARQEFAERFEPSSDAE